MTLDYGSVLGQAWRLTWNNKILWLFGILAGLGGGGANFNFNFGGGGGGGAPGSGGSGDLPAEFQRYLDSIDATLLIALAIGVACIGFLLIVVLIALSVIGRGGLIGGVRLADSSGRVTFGEAWAVGIKHFWTLFLIGLVVSLVSFALIFITVVPGALLAAVTFGVGIICLIPVICVLGLLSIVLGVVAYFAQIAAVVENLSVMPALSRAWAIIQANLGAIIVLGIITLVIGGVAGFVLSLPILGIVFPAMFAVMFSIASDTGVGLIGPGLIVAALCFVAYLPVLIVLSGILQTWTTAVWTLAYQQFTGAPKLSPYAVA